MSLGFPNERVSMCDERGRVSFFLFICFSFKIFEDRDMGKAGGIRGGKIFTQVVAVLNAVFYDEPP